ncbi:hypothetical protein AB840_04815 [Megasphaera cerevisiae DSM 20462]|jgi:transcriptional regulator with XRE-family HTH domain|uniref:HTH cro/C1-type domain-containing protein n=1 Tax=Megasphaera cerevisiae DSM 20462 TaxID=1122219 RepID=A0A0J6ZQ79_9FIRM|nr:helix-turn-helix transcriptional regulator [Megasphaera cerevisiae]KMO87086.1 hypothetical protein AB840_04815 [Megasphaera cerevisiae DSM 20462]OKY53483.1 hypothetical protein BSR42_07270 [Megasphaera cerevisiae]SJZ78377.1 Helix-turn-helix [Megasphaera cerevisiae DSM 20462]
MRSYLVKARAKAGLTQREAARALLISQNYLSDIEHGIRQKNIKLSTLKGFSRVYHVPTEVLIQLEEIFQNRLKRKEKNSNENRHII